MCPNPRSWSDTPPTSLERAAPGLAGQLRALFGDPLPNEVRLAYDQAVAAGALLEPGVERSEGASFNPRPARILSILLNDCRIADLSVLIAALQVSAPQGTEEGPIALAARRYLSDPGGTTAPADFNARAIAASIVLDTIRHLKMCPNPAPLIPALQAQLTNLLTPQSLTGFTPLFCDKLRFSARLIATMIPSEP